MGLWDLLIGASAVGLAVAWFASLSPTAKTAAVGGAVLVGAQAIGLDAAAAVTAAFAAAGVLLLRPAPALTESRQCCKRLAEGGAGVEEVARHEAGHYVAAKRRGSTSVSAEVLSGSRGVTWTGSDRSDLDAAVITAAGTEATNAQRWLFTDSTTYHDAQRLKKECARAGIAPGEARRLARKDVSRHSGEIDRVTERLIRDRKI